jgi:hypothetical protein
MGNVIAINSGMYLLVQGYIIVVVLAVLVPLLLIIRPYFVTKTQKNLIGAINTYEFSEDEILIDTTHSMGSSQSKCAYTYFKKVYETKDELYLYVTKYKACVMRKSDITNGNVEELHELLRRNIPSGKYKIKYK